MSLLCGFKLLQQTRIASTIGLKVPWRTSSRLSQPSTDHPKSEDRQVLKDGENSPRHRPLALPPTSCDSDSRLVIDSRIKQYAKLSKIRLTGFVTSTAITGSYIACESFADSLPVIAIAALGTFLCSSSAAALNQFLETPYDSQMRRTAIRPLVIGQVSPLETVIFASAAGLTGVALLATCVNSLTATLGAANILLYSFVYTPMKRSNVANTWLGSIVGAIPPLMGSTAVLGYVNFNSAILALILFSWQFPHFNALSWNLRHEYARAGYRMMSVVNPDLCKKVALRHSILLLIYTSLLPVYGSASSLFALCALPFNLQFIYLSWLFYKKADSASSRKLFKFSLLYLPALLGLLILNRSLYEKGSTHTDFNMIDLLKVKS